MHCATRWALLRFASSTWLFIPRAGQEWRRGNYAEAVATEKITVRWRYWRFCSSPSIKLTVRNHSAKTKSEEGQGHPEGPITVARCSVT